MNGLGSESNSPTPPAYLVVAYDALGGRFAVDGGGLGIGPGEVCYFGPDTLAWGGLGGGHADFVTAAVTGGLSEAFAGLRWPGWQDDVAQLRPDQGLALYPPPFTREGTDVGTVNRHIVPLSELLAFYEDCAR